MLGIAAEFEAQHAAGPLLRCRDALVPAGPPGMVSAAASSDDGSDGAKKTSGGSGSGRRLQSLLSGMEAVEIVDTNEVIIISSLPHYYSLLLITHLPEQVAWLLIQHCF